MTGEKYIALDVHQATISVAVMDAKGKVVMESILETKAASLGRLWLSTEDFWPVALTNRRAGKTREGLK